MGAGALPNGVVAETDLDDDKKLLATAGTQARRAAFGPGGGIGIPAEKSERFGDTVRRLGELLGRERLRLVAVLFLVVSSVFLVVLGPKLLGEATNIIVEGASSPNGIDFGALHHQLEIVFVIYLGSWALSFMQSYILAGVVQRSMYRLRESVEHKLNRLPLKYIDSQPRGDLLSRVTNDIDNLAQSLQQTISQILTSILTMIGVAIMMFIISPILAVIALSTVPVSLFLMRFIAGKARPRFMAQWRHTGMLNAQAEEVFTGHAIVKSFGRQREAEARFRRDNDELYGASFGAQFISSLIQPMTIFMGNIQFVLIAVVGGLKIANGSLSIGDMQAMIQYARQFAQPMTNLASMAATFQSGIASMERVLELLDADEQSTEQADTATPPEVRGRVVFDDVHFSYVSDKPLIEGLSVVAEPGETVAIVGPTGAGKTTLVNLIMRFYDLDAGSISLDGRDIASFPRHELRSKIGMVLQDTWLFGGTIRDNIAYGNPRRHRGADQGGGQGHLRRPLRALAAPGLRHGDQRRGRQHQRRREAVDDDRPGVPRRPVDPHPRRGDVVGRHPHGGADPGGDERAARQPDELRHRPPAVDDPRRRHDPRDGERPHRRAGRP